MSSSKTKKKPMSHTLLAGGTAGFVESSICHPLDTIKTRMQLRNNHIDSVGTRLRHSLVEPAVLHVRHSLVEPAMRFRHSLSEPSTIKHSLVEPANLIKLRRHSLADPSSMKSSRMDANSSSTSTYRMHDVTSSKLSNHLSGNNDIASESRKSTLAGNSELGNRGRIVKKLKSSSSTLVSTEKSNAAKCWWNQPKQNNVKTAVVDTSNRSFPRKKIVPNLSPSKFFVGNSIGRSKANNTAAWWNWPRNLSTTLASRGETSKSAAWCQPMNSLNANSYGDQHGRRRHGTLVHTNASRKGPLGPIQTARKIIRKEGFRSLYKGLSAVYVGIIPKMAIRFVSFEHYKDVIRRHTPLGEKSTNFTAGLSSGLTEAVLIVTPAEVCKIRMQSQRHSLLDPLEANARKYGNVVQTAMIIVREEGYSALYKGVVPTMLRQGCNQAVNFTAYSSMKTYWLERQWEHNLQHGENPEPSQQLPGTISMLIGGLSGAMGPIVNNPLDVVKTRLQKQNTAKIFNGTPKYTGLVQACLKIAKEEGASALWKGITPRLMRIVPGQAITFATYEAVCRWLQKGSVG